MKITKQCNPNRTWTGKCVHCGSEAEEDEKNLKIHRDPIAGEPDWARETCPVCGGVETMIFYKKSHASF